MDKIFEQMHKIGIIPVITINDKKDAVSLAKALIDGGLPCAEITFRTAEAKVSMASICKTYPDMLVGAGTVLTTEQVDDAISAGAKFVVSPGLNPKIVKYCQDKKIPIIPGCANPSDIEVAIELGIDVVKIFPAEAIGGLPLIKAMAAPYTKMRFMPTGGITEKNLKEYLAFPKILACGGSFMINMQMINAGNFHGITELTKKAVALLKNDSKPTKEILDANHKLAHSSMKKMLNTNAKKLFDVVSFGEIMMRLSPPNREKLAFCETLEKNAGGAEANVAAGISQLGLKTSVLSKLPSNEITHFIENKLRQAGVNLDYIAYDESPDARVGVYFYEQGASPRKPTVVYDRKFSSISRVSIDDFDESIFTKTRLFHVSGISMAVGAAARQVTIELIHRFKAAGAAISFDVNYRANLWSEEEAYETITEVLPYVDILFISEETSRRMFKKTGTLQDIMKSYCQEYNVSVVATTCRMAVSPTSHNFGSTIYQKVNDTFYTENEYVGIEVVDRIGSGDAFVAGSLFGMLKYSSCQKAIEFGDAMAAVKSTIAGDLIETDFKEINKIVESHHSVGVQSEMER